MGTKAITATDQATSSSSAETVSFRTPALSDGFPLLIFIPTQRSDWTCRTGTRSSVSETSAVRYGSSLSAN
jgi:hypothetical protein